MAAFCGTDILVAHNGYQFDFPVLSRVARTDFCTFDTLPLARELHSGSARLGDLAARFGIDAGVSHRALDDARTQLRRWAEVAREFDEDAFGERFHADLAEHVDDEQVLAAITQASDPRLEYAGLARYWHKLGNDRHPR